VLIAGATGAGKASLLWGLVRAMVPLMRAGLVRVLAADPKLMELAFGRVIFETYGAYAADPVAVAAMLEAAVADMQARAARFAGVQRDHTPTAEHPFVVILVDEVAFLTAYQPDRKLREKIMAERATRAERMAMPLARQVVEDLAVEHGACIRPIQLRRTNLDTGQQDTVLVPCGHTLASVCPPCAERAKTLRAAQCREGWHLEDEPDIEPDPATEDQQWWIEKRAEAQQLRDQAAADGQDTTDFDELIGELDEEITSAGMRGKAAPDRPARRHRSTRRRQDAPDLPRRKVSPRTVGKAYTAPDGKTFRPSLFVTLTCPPYGRVGADGTPADPDRYDYERAARDALAFAALFDRFIQNLRRYLGYDLQYFATVEPQRRLASHVHIAMRGTIARTEIRRVLAATYHQVWWPGASQVKYDGDQLPVWTQG
jgi:FtsK/SpoIIIE family